MKITDESKQFMMVQYCLFGLKGKYTTGKPKPNDNITLGDGEILLLCLIDNLSSNKDRTQPTCSASNAYFADVLNEGERNVKKQLLKLKTIGIIKTFEIRESGSYKTKSRLIYIQEEIINSILKEKNELAAQVHDNSGMGEQTGKDIDQSEGTNMSSMGNKHERIGEQTGKSEGTNGHPNNNNTITLKEQYYNNTKTENCNGNFFGSGVGGDAPVVCDFGFKEKEINPVEKSAPLISDDTISNSSLGLENTQTQITNTDYKFILDYYNQKDSVLKYLRDDITRIAPNDNPNDILGLWKTHLSDLENNRQIYEQRGKKVQSIFAFDKKVLQANLNDWKQTNTNSKNKKAPKIEKVLTEEIKDRQRTNDYLDGKIDMYGNPITATGTAVNSVDKPDQNDNSCDDMPF
jgi:hypothetical protein